MIRSEPLLQKTFQAEADRLISGMRQLVADHLARDADDFALGVFLDAAAGVAFRIAAEADKNRTQAQLETTLRAIDLLERGLPLD